MVMQSTYVPALPPGRTSEIILGIQPSCEPAPAYGIASKCSECVRYCRSSLKRRNLQVAIPMDAFGKRSQNRMRSYETNIAFIAAGGGSRQRLACLRLGHVPKTSRENTLSSQGALNC